MKKQCYLGIIFYRFFAEQDVIDKQNLQEKKTTHLAVLDPEMFSRLATA